MINHYHHWNTKQSSATPGKKNTEIAAKQSSSSGPPGTTKKVCLAMFSKGKNTTKGMALNSYKWDYKWIN